MATCRPSVRSLARQTSAMPPAPEPGDQLIVTKTGSGANIGIDHAQSATLARFTGTRLRNVTPNGSGSPRPSEGYAVTPHAGSRATSTNRRACSEMRPLRSNSRVGRVQPGSTRPASSVTRQGSITAWYSSSESKSSGLERHLRALRRRHVRGRQIACGPGHGSV
mgnify:CR=1 FL=1